MIISLAFSYGHDSTLLQKIANDESALYIGLIFTIKKED